MSFAVARILSGIVVVGAVAFGGAGAAQAQALTQVVGQGSLALGGLMTFTPPVDTTQFAQFEVDTTATDMTIMVTDDQHNIVCQTSLPNSSTQTCGWLPVSGASYTVSVMRPASAEAIAAAQSATVAANAGIDPNAITATLTNEQNGLGGATEEFKLSQPASN